MFVPTSCFNELRIELRMFQLSLPHSFFFFFFFFLRGQSVDLPPPNLGAVAFHKHYDTTAKPPEQHHLVSIDKHMPHHYHQSCGENCKWCHINKRVERISSFFFFFECPSGLPTTAGCVMESVFCPTWRPSVALSQASSLTSHTHTRSGEKKKKRGLVRGVN